MYMSGGECVTDQPATTRGKIMVGPEISRRLPFVPCGCGAKCYCWEPKAEIWTISGEPISILCLTRLQGGGRGKVMGIFACATERG